MANGKPIPKKGKTRKIKLLAVDKLMSLWIRERDNWTCQRCATKFTPPTNGLHHSHFVGRGNKSTRWLPENGVALCYGCHSHLDGAGREEYREFMLKRLGKKGFEELLKKGRQTTSESTEKIKALAWLKK